MWYAVAERAGLWAIRHLGDGDDQTWRYGRPLITVYIPTHNRVELLLNRALPSVLRQSYINIEVIVAAHGCTDGTLAEVRDIARRDYRIKWLDVPRSLHFPATADNFWFAGRVQPANAALAMASGQWIATIDDDDMWEPDCLEKLLRAAQANNLEFISAAADRPDGPIAPYDVHGVKVGALQTWMFRRYLRFMRFNPDCWRKSWNRVCDTDLQARFRQAGVRMGYLERVVAHILPRPGSTLIGLAAYRADPAATERHYAI